MSWGLENTSHFKAILCWKTPKGPEGTLVEACKLPAPTDEAYTMDELFTRQTQDTAPGSDGICGSHLVHVGLAVCREMLFIFNMSYDEGRLLDQWRETEIVPILKPKQPDIAHFPALCMRENYKTYVVMFPLSNISVIVEVACPS